MSDSHVSDSVNSTKVISILALGSLLVLVISYLHQWSLSGNAGPISRIGVTLIYAFALLYCVGRCVGWAEVEGKTLWVFLFGIFLGFFAEYVGWIFFCYFIKHEFIILPNELWATMKDIGEHGFSLRGAASTGSNTIGMRDYSSGKGNGNYLAWSVEAVFIIGAALFGAWIGPLKGD